ncbi:MAG: DUF2252 domain-containing protein [Thermoleophilaceae bacterium]
MAIVEVITQDPWRRTIRDSLPPLEERLAFGRALRDRVPRSELGRWKPAPDRPDPVDLISITNVGRVKELVPIRVGRMAASPFTFLRGAAAQMAADLASAPMSGVVSWICGDAHLSNFGLYASPERSLVFDLNDFDEAIIGPREWDLKRLGASIVVAARSRGFADNHARAAVLGCMKVYRLGMRELAGLPLLDTYRIRWREDQPVDLGMSKKTIKQGQKLRQKAETRTNDHALRKLTTTQRDGRWCFDEQPPLLTRLPEVEAERVAAALERYTSTLSADRRDLVNAYAVQDVAFKVVGVGSVGTRAYVAALAGNGDRDALFLQVKEAPGSQLAPYLPEHRMRHQGERVVEAQLSLQALSDPFLGWTTIGRRHFYVRQLRDMKGAVEIETMRPRGLIDYSRLLGGTLAMAHARCGDPAVIAGYLGKGDHMDRAMAEFAFAYADQTERDHDAVVKAIKAGRLPAEFGV